MAAAALAAAGATGVSTETSLTLSERADPTTASTPTPSLLDNGLGQYRSGTVTVAPNGRSITFTPSAPLRASAVYSWYLNRLTDLAGQVFD